MTLKQIERKIYLLLPKKNREKIKDFYYDYILFFLQNLKNLIYYGKWNFFNSVGIETTTYCNLRCKFCPNSKYERSLFKNKKLMHLKLFKKIVNELAKLKYRGRIALEFYGEPLTDKRLPDLIAYIREKVPKAKIVMHSNGVLFTISLYKKLINSGINFINVSQHGKKMPLAMKKVFEYLKTRPKKENKINYRIFNENELSEGSAIYNVGGEIKIKNIPNRPLCSLPSNEIIVDYAGNVVLCCMDYHSSIKFGNLKNKKVIDIWNSQSYKKIKKEIRKKIYNFQICKKCMGLIK